MSLRDEILAIDDKPIAAVIVPQWDNKTVYLRMLLASERDKFDKETVKRKKKDAASVRVRERLVILCAQDEHGAPLFKPEDEEALANKGNAAIDRLFRIACKHNGFIEEDEDSDSGN